MVHVFRLGPLEVGGRKSYAYCGLDADNRLIPPEITHTDAKGLGALAKRYAGQPVRCEPALAEAARPFGFEPAPLPEAAGLPRATLAYGLALGPMAGRPKMDVLVRFLEACAVFWNARPWELMESEEPIPVTLTENGRTRRAEASVMGAGGREYGVAMYDEPGSIHRVAALVSEGRMKETRHVSALAVTFDEEPAWAAAALEDEFGLPRLPVPIRVRKGKGGPATTEELLDAAALLEAVAELCSPNDADHAEITVEAGSRTITACVALPDDDGGELLEDLAEPMLVPEPISATARTKTPRNAPCPCGSGRKYKKCHLAEDEEREAAARGTGREAEEARSTARRLAERDPIHAFDERITADALALARRRWGARVRSRRSAGAARPRLPVHPGAPRLVVGSLPWLRRPDRARPLRRGARRRARRGGPRARRGAARCVLQLPRGRLGGAGAVDHAPRRALRRRADGRGEERVADGTNA